MHLKKLLLMGILVLIPGIAMGAPVTQSFTYQGTLMNSGGTPLNGNYQVTFSLYEAASGGSALASYGPTSVTVTKGQFTTPVTIDSSFFDGRALWLGIKVGADPEMTPRQEIRPVPYALGLRPGVVGASFTTSKAGTSWFIPAVNISTKFSWNPGVLINTTGPYSPGIYTETAADHSYGMLISTKGFDSPGLYADSSQDVGVYARGREGGYFTTRTAGTSSTSLAGVNVSTYYDFNPGISIKTRGNRSYAIYAESSFPLTHAIYATTTGAGSAAVYGKTDCMSCNGVIGETTAEGPAAVAGITSGPNSPGVYGRTSSWGAHGVYGTTSGSGSYGIYAESERSYGVYSDGEKGGYFTTNKAGGDYEDQWLPGIQVKTKYEHNPGIRVDTHAQDSDGIFVFTRGLGSTAINAYSEQSYAIGASGAYGGSFSTTQAGTADRNHPGITVLTNHDYNTGINIETLKANSPGIAVKTEGAGSNAIYAESAAPGNPTIYAVTKGQNSAAVLAHTDCPGCNAIVGETTYDGPAAIAGIASGVNSPGLYGKSTQSHGVYGDTDNPAAYGIYTPDRLYAGGAVLPSGDIAEYMPVTEYLLPGTVLVIGEEGRLGMTSTAYDTRVAGIVSTQPGVSLAANEKGNPGEAQVAVAGRVPCNVDASNEPIHPGDLLTTSTNPGYAMKAEPLEVNGRIFYPSGTILGKAMGTLESGTGTIEVLVTLQ